VYRGAHVAGRGATSNTGNLVLCADDIADDDEGPEMSHDNDYFRVRPN
jgi:hypothetical protein